MIAFSLFMDIRASLWRDWSDSFDYMLIMSLRVLFKSSSYLSAGDIACLRILIWLADQPVLLLLLVDLKRLSGVLLPKIWWLEDGVAVLTTSFVFLVIPVVLCDILAVLCLFKLVVLWLLFYRLNPLLLLLYYDFFACYGLSSTDFASLFFSMQVLLFGILSLNACCLIIF